MIKVMLPLTDLAKPSWSYQSSIDSPLDNVDFHGLAIDYEMANSELSSIFHSDVCQDKLLNYPHQVEVCLNPSSTEYQSFDEVEDYFDWMEYEGNSPSRESSIDGTSTSIMKNGSPICFGNNNNNSLVLPNEDMEIDGELSISHLLKALGEAKENRYDDLAYVISKRLEEKACPKGSVLNRLAYYLGQSSNSNLDHYYLAQEAIKNYDVAFGLFYQLFPYGRLAHFVANSSILEALPRDTKIVYIVDFDMGEGVQWPPLIEAIAKKHPKIAVRLISLKQEENNYVFPIKSFGNIKKWLYEHANTYSRGLNLTVEEMGVEELATEMKIIGSSRGTENWVAFNCMRDLPHMGKQTSSRRDTAFLNVAHEYLGGYNSNKGMLTIGSGSCIEEKNNYFQSFGSKFEAELRRTKALLESMEVQLPSHLTEARVAMECLFVAPFVFSLNKVEARESKDELVLNRGLAGRKISKYAVAEAKELVGEGHGLYCIKTEGENENEVVLSYGGTPLVRVSSWST